MGGGKTYRKVEGVMMAPNYCLDVDVDGLEK